MKLAGIIVALVVAILTTGQTAAQDQRILNGDEVGQGEFPFIVSITILDEHICGGFIYSTTYVMTAASCVDGKNPGDMAVVVAQISLIQQDPGEATMLVYSFNIHPDYNPTTKANDIALIKLAREITYGPNINYCRYGDLNGNLNSATIVGWGAMQDGGTPSIKLRKAVVSLPADCRLYGSEEYVSATMICAGDNVKDRSSPCVYDEGSPLVQDGLIIGIMSKNLGCNEGFPPTIYTRPTAFYVWIANIAGQQPMT